MLKHWNAALIALKSPRRETWWTWPWASHESLLRCCAPHDVYKLPKHSAHAQTQPSGSYYPQKKRLITFEILLTKHTFRASGREEIVGRTKLIIAMHSQQQNATDKRHLQFHQMALVCCIGCKHDVNTLSNSSIMCHPCAKHGNCKPDGGSSDRWIHLRLL